MKELPNIDRDPEMVAKILFVKAFASSSKLGLVSLAMPIISIIFLVLDGTGFVTRSGKEALRMSRYTTLPKKNTSNSSTLSKEIKTYLYK